MAKPREAGRNRFNRILSSKIDTQEHYQVKGETGLYVLIYLFQEYDQVSRSRQFVLIADQGSLEKRKK